MLNKKGIVGIIVCLVVVVLLSKFGGSNIVGRWESVEDAFFDELEFFSDGTYTSDHSNYFGSYSIEGNRLRLSGVLFKDRIYTFELRGNKLTLVYENEYVYKYEKVK